MDEAERKRLARASVVIAIVAVLLTIAVLFVTVVLLLQHWDSIYGA
jgi:hypothetical protein